MNSRDQGIDQSTASHCGGMLNQHLTPLTHLLLKEGGMSFNKANTRY
jgi:hypothetical protein